MKTITVLTATLLLASFMMVTVLATGIEDTGELINTLGKALGGGGAK